VPAASWVSVPCLGCPGNVARKWPSADTSSRASVPVT
jgi:hypothetical protein